jgi:catechol 2,3-dioxygenase-like lactoylglutathione lyase family enzyme
MPAITSSGYAHVRITVTDIARSKAFYDNLFGWPTAVDNSAAVGEPGVTSSPRAFYGGVVYQTPSGALFGLRPVAPSGQRFDSEHVGLDHVSFAVESRAVLDDARAYFAAQSVEHGEIIDLADAGIAILSFTDPDGIHGELTAPLG